MDDGFSAIIVVYDNKLIEEYHISYHKSINKWQS